MLAKQYLNLTAGSSSGTLRRAPKLMLTSPSSRGKSEAETSRAAARTHTRREGGERMQRVKRSAMPLVVLALGAVLATGCGSSTSSSAGSSSSGTAAASSSSSYGSGKQF